MNAYKSINRLFLVMVLVYIIGVNAAAMFFWDYLESVYTSTALCEFFALIVPCIYVIRKQLDFEEDLGFSYFNARAILSVFGAALLLLPLINLINLVAQLFVSSTGELIAEELQQGTFGLNLLFVALIPALVEEIIFRGLIYRQYRKHGILIAMMFSAVLFGFFHLNFNQFFYAVVAGMFMSILMEVTGSTWACVLGHITINGYSVIVQAIYMRQIELMSDAQVQELLAESSEIGATDILINVLFAAACLFLSYRLLKRTARICNRSFTWKQIIDADRVKYVTIPLILGIVICLAYMIWYELSV